MLIYNWFLTQRKKDIQTCNYKKITLWVDLILSWKITLSLRRLMSPKKKKYYQKNAIKVPDFLISTSISVFVGQKFFSKHCRSIWCMPCHLFLSAHSFISLSSGTSIVWNYSQLPTTIRSYNNFVVAAFCTLILNLEYYEKRLLVLWISFKNIIDLKHKVMQNGAKLKLAIFWKSSLPPSPIILACIPEHNTRSPLLFITTTKRPKSFHFFSKKKYDSDIMQNCGP